MRFSMLVWLCHVLSVTMCLAQATITYPSDRVIFQRDQSNQAVVTIAGYFNSCQDRVEARFVPIQSNPARPAMGQAAPTGGGWEVIQSTPTCGNFRGAMTVHGGWYRLELRGIKNNTYTTAEIDHVGVGEVFLISGQSNATGGDSNPNGNGAVEDAVSSVNFRTEIDQYSKLKVDCPVYTHLDANTTTAPFGNYAWCWGYFGDRMVQKLNVPVMIFNTGWSGSSIANWKESIPVDGTTIAWFGYQYPKGLPFGNMRIALNNYISQLGVRAILLHQGESDTRTGTSREAYRNDLKEVIEACRAVSNKPNLPIVVSRASRFSFEKTGDSAPVSYTSADVIAAQNDIIGQTGPGYQSSYKVPNTFPGPITDDYYNSTYRHDEIHFSGAGLDSLAKFWVTKLDDNFFQNAIPYPAITPATVQINHTGGSYTLTAEAGWNAYNWIPPTNCNDSTQSGPQRTATPGLIALKTVDAYNNVVMSPALNITASSLPVTWLYFKGNSSQNLTNDLTWATSEEDQTANFEVERADASLNFEKIGTLPAAGNSKDTKTYSFHDQVLQVGTYYYRIKQVDLDGQSSYSNVIGLKASGRDLIRLFPNPVISDLSIQSEKAIHSIEVYNAIGMKVHQNYNPVNSVKLDMSRYQPGVYIFVINGERFTIVK